MCLIIAIGRLAHLIERVPLLANRNVRLGSDPPFMRLDGGTRSAARTLLQAC